MLEQIKLFFDQHIAQQNNNQTAEHKLQIACAALFIEMMLMDDKAHQDEEKIISCSLQDNFSLNNDEAENLLILAKQERKQATDYYQFTSLINKAFSQQEKVSLIKNLWQIAYADGELDIHEEYMVRKIADLLHVPHIQFIKTKHQANRD